MLIAKSDDLKHHKTWTIQFLAGVGWVENNSELKAYVSRKNLVLSNELIKAELQPYHLTIPIDSLHGIYFFHSCKGTCQKLVRKKEGW